MFMFTYDPISFFELFGSIAPSAPSPPAIAGHRRLPTYLTKPLSCRPQMTVPSADATAE